MRLAINSFILNTFDGIEENWVVGEEEEEGVVGFSQAYDLLRVTWRHFDSNILEVYLRE